MDIAAFRLLIAGKELDIVRSDDGLGIAKRLRLRACDQAQNNLLCLFKLRIAAFFALCISRDRFVLA